MDYPEVIHHGAFEGVSGSCHQLQMDAAHALLIDCGLFQGNDAVLKGRYGESPTAVDFDVRTLRLLIITHVHADHIGRIPQLLAKGFKGPILCSEPSARLMPLLLEDALKHEQGQNERQIEAAIQQIGEHIIGVPFDTWFTVVDKPDLSCRVRLQRAGHILGSAYVECDLHYPLEQRSRRIVFSGDLGSSHTPSSPT